MVRPAEQLEIRRMGRAERVRDRVIDVGELGRPVAAGKPARQIPASDELRERRRRAVVRLSPEILGPRHGSEFGPRREAADRLGRQCAVAGQITGRCAVALAGDRVRLSQQVNDDLARVVVGVTGRGAVVRPTTAGHPRAARGKGAKGIGTALALGPRIVGAHCRGELIEPTVEHRSVRRPDRSPEVGQSITCRTDFDVTIVVGVASGSEGGRIHLADPPVDDLVDFVPGQRIPSGCITGQSFVHACQHIGVADQAGAKNRGDNDAKVDPTRCERRAELRQPLDELQAVVHLR